MRLGCVAGISHLHRKSIIININAVNKEESLIQGQITSHIKEKHEERKDLEQHLRRIQRKERFQDRKEKKKVNLQKAVRKETSGESSVVDPF